MTKLKLVVSNPNPTPKGKETEPALEVNLTHNERYLLSYVALVRSAVNLDKLSIPELLKLGESPDPKTQARVHLELMSRELYENIANEECPPLGTKTKTAIGALYKPDEIS